MKGWQKFGIGATSAWDRHQVRLGSARHGPIGLRTVAASALSSWGEAKAAHKEVVTRFATRRPRAVMTWANPLLDEE
jgi:hypothetical protein